MKELHSAKKVLQCIKFYIKKLVFHQLEQIFVESGLNPLMLRESLKSSEKKAI